MVVCNAGKAGAAAGREFVAFVQSPEGHAVMRRFGLPAAGRVDRDRLALDLQ